MTSFFSHQAGGDIVLRLKVLPRARTDAIGGLLGDRLKLRITAPPVDGKANQHLLLLLARLLGVRAAQLHLEAGEQAREKTVRISGLDAQDRARLLAQCADWAEKHRV